MISERLLVRMAVRRTYKMGMSVLNRVGGGPISANNSNARWLNSDALFSGKSNHNSSSFYSSFRHCNRVTFVSNYYSIDRKRVSTKQNLKSPPEVPTVNMGSILEHHKYKELKSKLSKMRRKGFNLGPLDTASLYILSSKDLTVNLEILSLDALSPSSHCKPMCKGYAEIQEMKQRGAVKKGKLNKEDEAAIEKRFEILLAKTNLDKEALMEELFAANKGCINNWDKDFMLKRQLAGFYLLQGMKDGDRRLPMEVYTKLAVLLYSGSFTKEEDAAILAWVDKHGATRWTELARNLGRKYLRAGPTVQNRYEELTGKAKGDRQGAFDSEELAVLIGEVMKQDPEGFEKPLEGNDLDFKSIAFSMGRPRMGMYNVYAGTVHPTLRRHKLGTLEKDVRGELIQQVKENGWNLSADIEFDKLARLSQFEGHNGTTLHNMYNRILVNTLKQLSKKSTREVTVEEVEEWWNSSTRHAKKTSLIEKEQQIVEAYFMIKRDSGIGKM